MPRFYVLSGPTVGRTFELADGGVIGRGDDCDAVLPEASVSRRHARLAREGERWVLADLESQNGIRVDGRRVSRCELADGDQLVLGKVTLRIRLAPDEAPEAPRPRSGDRKPAGDDAVTIGIDPSSARAKHGASREARRADLLVGMQDEPGGFLRGDLAQRPLPLRLFLYLLALAIAVGVFIGAFELTQFLRR